MTGPNAHVRPDRPASPDLETELDLYAAEFAMLVEHHRPSRRDTPWSWLPRLPVEALEYYRQGLRTFGARAQTPVQRRGRLYLMHTALLFMWMSWGKEAARVRFRNAPQRATRRAGYLVLLECYRRSGVIARYRAPGWFYRPVGEWPLSVDGSAVRIGTVTDADLRTVVSNGVSVRRDLRTLCHLRSDGAIPGLAQLPLGEARKSST
jgi:hypothetical protein